MKLLVGIGLKPIPTHECLIIFFNTYFIIINFVQGIVIMFNLFCIYDIINF